MNLLKTIYLGTALSVFILPALAQEQISVIDRPDTSVVNQFYVGNRQWIFPKP